MSTTIEYRCADGTPFPVTFARPEDAAIRWVLEREHYPGRMTPLAAAAVKLGGPGTQRAFNGAGLPVPSTFRDILFPFGYSYVPDVQIGEAEMAEIIEGCAKLLERWGSAEGIWRDCSLPKVKESCAWLDDAGPEVGVAALAERQAQAWADTMISVLVSGNDLTLLAQVCEAVHGDKATLVAHELAQGYENETTRADQRLWELGRLVSDSPALRGALDDADPGATVAAHREAGRDAAFFAALDAFMQDYGRRAEAWDISWPTWVEGGPGFWHQLRTMSLPATPSPERALERAAARREELVAETERGLGTDEALRARFHRRVARIASYVGVREERALWQLVSTGCLRHALLRRGEALARRGVIRSAADVLFLLPEEVDDPPSGLHDAVEARRAEHAEWSRRTPPDQIGGEGAETAGPEAPGAPPAAAAAGAVVLRGVAGSRGTVTATARIVTRLADADRLAPGEVLVCVMTSPPWTPLFGIASAVVTDSGDVASHPAIAAREYGIPCVLGVRVGTTAIPDGATVTVDGTAGTVTTAG